MVNICTVASRKGGVGKSTIAYELAYVLDAVLLDLDWDAGAVSVTWGYRAEDRATDPLMRAIETERPPRVLQGHNKPKLVPHSPDLVDVSLGVEEWRRLLSDWSQAWGSEWVVIDTHPGASMAAHAAMSLANVVLSPFGLRTKDLEAVRQIVTEMADYPLVLVPNFVPRVPPATELNELKAIINGTPVQVAPYVPNVSQIATRRRRMAITAQQPVPKALQAAEKSYRSIADYVKEYVK